jgi:hypothetical protein
MDQRSFGGPGASDRSEAEATPGLKPVGCRPGISTGAKSRRLIAVAAMARGTPGCPARSGWVSPLTRSGYRRDCGRKRALSAERHTSASAAGWSTWTRLRMTCRPARLWGCIGTVHGEPERDSPPGGSRSGRSTRFQANQAVPAVLVGKHARALAVEDHERLSCAPRRRLSAPCGLGGLDGEPQGEQRRRGDVVASVRGGTQQENVRARRRGSRAARRGRKVDPLGGAKTFKHVLAVTRCRFPNRISCGGSVWWAPPGVAHGRTQSPWFSRR